MYRATDLVKIKVSKIGAENKNDHYYMCGQAFVQTLDKIYNIPFGAEDRKRIKCVKKTESELIERLTWINLYLQNKKFFNTLGFAAHVDIRLSAINSVLEVYERKLFNELCKAIIENNDISNEFEIIKKKESIINVKPVIFKNIFYYLLYSFSNDGKVAFGMGKSRNKNVAVENSLLEKDVIQGTLMHEIKDKNCMTYEEWQEFNKISLAIGVDNKIFRSVFFEKKKIAPFLIDENQIAIYDMKYFIPSEVSGKREVTFCIEKDDIRNAWMIGREVNAVKI